MRCDTQETGVNSHAYRLSECTPSRTAPGSSGNLPSRPPVEWGSELAGNPIHSRSRHPQNRSQIKIYRRSSRLPTPSHHRPSETFWKVPSQTCGAPGASEPELYKIMNVRGRPPPPFLCRKIWETISYDQNYAELVESCPVSQLVSRAPAGVPLLLRCHGWCPGWSPGWSPGWTPLVSRFVSRLADCMNERMHK